MKLLSLLIICFVMIVSAPAEAKKSSPFFTNDGVATAINKKFDTPFTSRQISRQMDRHSRNRKNANNVSYNGEEDQASATKSKAQKRRANRNSQGRQKRNTANNSDLND